MSTEQMLTPVATERRQKWQDTPDPKRQIIRKCQKYTPGSRICDVCLSEKLAIMENKEYNSLNQRTELMNRCIHLSLKT